MILYPKVCIIYIYIENGVFMSNLETLIVSNYSDIKDNIGNNKSIILSFGMKHCYSCLAMSKVFKLVLNSNPSLQIYSIDSQKDRLISRDKYNLKEMPSQIFLDKNGVEVFRHTGAYKKAIIDIILKKYSFL
jgi:thioredoxin 1